MRVMKVIVRRLAMKLRQPFVTSYGVEQEKDVLLLEVQTETPKSGFAECVAMPSPYYNEETTETALYIISKFLIPLIWRMEWQSREDLWTTRFAFRPVRHHEMAKAALEMAVWDAFAAEYQQPISQLLGGVKKEIPVGISVGIETSLSHLLKQVGNYVEQGYQRVKLKIQPGWDYVPLQALRSAFPRLQLLADANSAYRLEDAEQLKQLDSLGLVMIEQPLEPDDILHHAQLQAKLDTPICLDESIRSASDVKKAAEMGACKVINLKPGRVGGFAESIEIHNICVDNGLELWCGGMFETGIGRLHNIALTSLPGFTLPGDTSPSDRYFERDIINPPVVFSRPGFLSVDPLVGVQERIDWSEIERSQVSEYVFERPEI